MFSAGSSEVQVIAIEAGETIKTQNSSTNSMMLAEAHPAIVDALRQTGHESGDVGPGGEDDAGVALLCLGMTVPEEGVAVTHLLQLAFFGEPSVAE
nr:unnamed protein product [Spirometra erinaceieuropaei]